MAVNIYDLEKAIHARFSGKILETLRGKVQEVPIFFDYPDLEEHPDQKYPSICITLNGLDPEEDLFDSQHEYEEMIFNGDIPIFQTRRVSEYYRFRYEIETYCLSTIEDREIMRWVESQLKPRDSLTVNDVDYHMFRESFSSNNIVNIDTVIYSKRWNFSVVADIEDVDNDVTSKGIKEVSLDFYAVKSINKIIPPDGNQPPKYVYDAPLSSDSAEFAEKTLHRSVAFDDQTYWFNKK